MQTDRSLSALSRTRGSGSQDRLELYKDLWLEVHSCELKPLQWPSGLHNKHETDRMDPSKWGVRDVSTSELSPRLRLERNRTLDLLAAIPKPLKFYDYPANPGRQSQHRSPL